jgi:hypothetical protein
MTGKTRLFSSRANPAERHRQVLSGNRYLMTHDSHRMNHRSDYDPSFATSIVFGIDMHSQQRCKSEIGWGGVESSGLRYSQREIGVGKDQSDSTRMSLNSTVDFPQK